MPASRRLVMALSRLTSVLSRGEVDCGRVVKAGTLEELAAVIGPASAGMFEALAQAVEKERGREFLECLEEARRRGAGEAYARFYCASKLSDEDMVKRLGQALVAAAAAAAGVPATRAVLMLAGEKRRAGEAYRCLERVAGKREG